MNPEQAKSGVRWFVTAFGSAITGFIVGKGWLTAQQVSDILSSEAFLSAMAAIVAGIWGLWAKTNLNIVKSAALVPNESKEIKVEKLAMAAAVPEVKMDGIVLDKQKPGAAILANAVPSPKVVAK